MFVSVVKFERMLEGATLFLPRPQGLLVPCSQVLCLLPGFGLIILTVQAFQTLEAKIRSAGAQAINHNIMMIL